MDQEYRHRLESEKRRHPIVLLFIYAAVALSVPGTLALKAQHPRDLFQATLLFPFLGPAVALGVVSLLRPKGDPRPLGGWGLKVFYFVLACGASGVQWFLDSLPPMMLFFAAPFYLGTGLVTGMAAGFLHDRGWQGAAAVWLWLWLGVIGYYAATVGGAAIALELGVPIWLEA